MTDPGRIVIIGAGPTGLGAARRLRDHGYADYVVLERAPSAGGLASSFIDDSGFTWDVGGHVQFSHYSYYDDVLDDLSDVEWLHHERESWVWFRDRFVPYPFQNNIQRLEAEECSRILNSMEAASVGRRDGEAYANFRDWIFATFGVELARIFFVPYNEKVWGFPLEMLGTSWMGERVAVPDLDRIRGNIENGRDDVSWGPNATFRFPLRGGTGAIWRSVASRFEISKIRYSSEVASVDTTRGTVNLRNGESESFDTLISSMPIPELCRVMMPLDRELIDSAESLTFSSCHIIGIGLSGEMPSHLLKKCWMYFPGSDSPYYRVTVFSNYSPNNVPAGDGYWSLMAEVCETPRRPVERETIIEEVIEGMRRDRLIPDQTNIVARWHRFEPYGYPTPTQDRDNALSRLLPVLEERRIFSRGRFGSWKYEASNQDHSFMQGVEVVDRLLFGERENTLLDPNYANSGVFLRREPGD